ncbi:MAG: TRAP transporter substrate-binding protein DctP [Candidatus Neomarinimicrobiota bacterium]|nr:TRAP transporter substrate-binding protein DctP [Candidatus Neomarinimicrobiota bacterium]MED5451220.1 TRAP transporter substrate-binding protein DctP [Candidatus Neomarinimicrobiota bacterium]MEE3241516.1 TRAP transporter substrate-binding protein DctP [Candidatus Neomarinimicrobiota bacterium]MEE3302058.1 TRAP transporter substrate-binding protein DctP [Candidatus Neomarinimicrobiota bacterium]
MINFIKTIFLLIICSGTLISKPIVIKLATLAPEGTEYYNLLLEMGQRWQEETNGEIILRIYPNGVVGRESDTIRKMRIGQIQASAMSSIGLADLTDQIQAFTIPMKFKDYDDVESVKEVMFDDISNGLSESGFKLLFLVDIGWVYWFSANEIAVPEDLRNAKIYTTAGDYVTVELFKQFGFNAIPVSETDILTSLQTGMINSMQTVPILSLSSGWFALMPNMLDLKWAVFIGAVIVDERVWSKIRPEHQKVMMEIAQEIGKKYQENGRKTDAQAIEMMKKYGMNVKTPTDEELKIWNDFKEKIMPDVIDTYVPKDIYDKVTSAIDE